MKIIIMRGLPASGKSTWARNECLLNPNTYRVNRDDIRAMLGFKEFNDHNERLACHIRDAIIIECLSSNNNVIVDDTNLSMKHLKRINEIAKIMMKMLKLEIEVEIKDLTGVPLNTCIERDALREKPVGESVIRNMYERCLV